MSRFPRTAKAPVRCGMTLIEMTMSLLISSILMVALGSSIMIASRAIPSGNTSIDAANNTAEALHRLVAELMFAKTVTELTSTAVTFTVAPRGADTADETIRWAWDGVVGHPLTRQYNGGIAAPVLKSVQSLNMTHTTSSTLLPPTYGPTAELLLASNTGVSTPASDTVVSPNCFGQYIVPALPASTVTWSVTRAIINAASTHASGNGSTTIQLVTAVAGMPATPVLDSATLLGSSLTKRCP